MAMETEHELEVAKKVVKCLLEKIGVRLSHDSRREMGNMSKKIGVPLSEVEQFLQPLLKEVFDECFPPIPTTSK